MYGFLVNIAFVFDTLLVVEVIYIVARAVGHIPLPMCKGPAPPVQNASTNAMHTLRTYKVKTVYLFSTYNIWTS